MTVHHRHIQIFTFKIHIVHQQSHAHSPVSRFKQLISKQIADEIIVKKVILNINAPFRNVGQYSPCNKSIQTVPQK